MDRTAAFLRLVRDAPVAHLVIGGSLGTRYETCVSDLDAFLVADDDMTAEAARIFLAGRSGRSVDLERMTRVRFNSLAETLERYSPSLTAGFSPFAFHELRFLARSRLGRSIIADPEIEQKLTLVEHRLRVAAAFYLSSMFIMRYQDAFGLLQERRFEDLAILAGELTQLACSVATLQTQLSDLSPKSAPRRAIDSDSGGVPQLARRLVRLACQADFEAPDSWARSLLRCLNSVISAGILSARGSNPSQLDPECIWSPEQCVMGVPGYLTVMNVLNDRAWIANEGYLFGLVASELRD